MVPSKNLLYSQIRLVVFDLDGTLYKKRGMVGKMVCAAPFDWRCMLAERKTRKQLRGQYLQDMETFYRIYFQTMASYCKMAPEMLRQWYEDKYMPLMVSIIHRNYKLVEWFAAFVDDCRGRGIKLVVLSDYGHTHEKLEALGVDATLFDWVVSAPELGGLKPAPELLIKVAERMGVGTAECLVVGDREDTDVQLAKSVGAHYFLV